MKILLAIVFAALPAAVSAQAVSDTLDMVQGLSASAASDNDLSSARVEAGKPFSAMISPSPVSDLQGLGFPGGARGRRNNHRNQWGGGNHGSHHNPPIIIRPPHPDHHPDYGYPY